MTTLKNTTIPAWHFIKSNGELRYSHFQNERFIDKVYPGQILSIAEHRALEMCYTGLHASLRALDAFKYHSTAKLCRVEVSDEIVFSDDKLCARKRKTLWIADLTTVLPKFRDYLIEILFNILCKYTKRKDPFKMKKLSFLKKMEKGEKIVNYNNDYYYNDYGNIVDILISLYGYRNGKYTCNPNIDMVALERAISEIKNNCSLHEQLNAKFEELVYSAPKTYAKI